MNLLPGYGGNLRTNSQQRDYVLLPRTRIPQDRHVPDRPRRTRSRESDEQPAANIRQVIYESPEMNPIAIRNKSNRPPWVLRRDARQRSLVCRGIRKRRVA